MPHPLAPPSHARRRLALPAALALALFAAACDDAVAPTEPRAAAPRASIAGGAATLARPALHPNRTRYRYDGARPATGRSGSASLTMQALLGRDGTTEVQISTGVLDNPWWPPVGTLAHVQTRASSPDGKHAFTRVHPNLAGGGSASFGYGGLTRGSELQVQATVKDIDPHRADVVTVTGTVRRRPNLAVTAVGVPARVRSGALTNIIATVRETNGDLGTWGVCTLHVDGRPVDWARWVWVDAGDVVTCAFTHAFAGDGTHRVEARVEPDLYEPRDDDPADNSAAVEVESFTTNELFYDVRVFDLATRDSTVTGFRWRSGSAGNEQFGQRVQESRNQQVSLSAWMPRSVAAGTLRLEVAEMTEGATIASGAYALPDWFVLDDAGSFCTWGVDAGTMAQVFLCSYAYGGTDFRYVRTAGSATYHSQTFSRTWDGLTGEEYVHTVNTSGSSSGGLLAPLGGDFAMRVRLYAGDEVFTADPVFPLTTSEWIFDFPYSCFGFEDPYWGYSTEWCHGFRMHSRSVSGSAWS